MAMTKKTAPHIPRTINVLLFLLCTTPLDAVSAAAVSAAATSDLLTVTVDLVPLTVRSETSLAVTT